MRRLAHSEDLRDLLCVPDGHPGGDREFCFRGPSHSVHGPRLAIMATCENKPLACRFAEPPIGIEPMTYALRGGREASIAVRTVTPGLVVGATVPGLSRLIQAHPGLLLADALALSARRSGRLAASRRVGLRGRTPVACAAERFPHLPKQRHTAPEAVAHLRLCLRGLLGERLAGRRLVHTAFACRPPAFARRPSAFLPVA
jgi:hypothetical protein